MPLRQGCLELSLYPPLPCSGSDSTCVSLGAQGDVQSHKESPGGQAGHLTGLQSQKGRETGSQQESSTRPARAALTKTRRGCQARRLTAPPRLLGAGGGCDWHQSSAALREPGPLLHPSKEERGSRWSSKSLPKPRQAAGTLLTDSSHEATCGPSGRALLLGSNADHGTGRVHAGTSAKRPS